MTLIRPELGVTIIPGKLFLHCLQEKPQETICDHYFNFDECTNILFEPMSRENGPSTLQQITDFIKLIKEKLTKINKQIHICVSLGPESRLNCIFLLCVFVILERNFVYDLINKHENKQYISKYGKSKPKKLPDFDHPLTIFDGIYPPLEVFEDATASPFTISLEDALNGFIKGTKKGWFDHRSFDIDSYNFYIAPENGFMTWVVPNRLLVLAAPGTADAPLLFDMLPLFRKWKIYTVVSFTTELRGSEDLSRVGIDQMTFDVSQDALPTIADVLKFCELCDEGHAVAICSTNGLGRGPMFAAAWLIHSFGFQPKEAIGWVRSVRQGAIYGVQQDFLMRVDRTIHPDTTPIIQAKAGPTISMRKTRNAYKQSISKMSATTTTTTKSRLSNAGKTISRLNSPQKKPHY